MLLIGLVVGGMLTNAVIAEPGTVKKKAFTLSSTSFKKSGNIPAKFATEKVKGGKNISPELHWVNAPKGTKSFALICVDLNPVAKRWVHWMVINIPADVKSIELNASLEKMPAACIELDNSYGDEGWGGPQPPKNTGIHKYVFGIYALKVEKIESKPKNEKQFLKAIKGKVISKAILTGFFQL